MNKYLLIIIAGVFIASIPIVSADVLSATASRDIETQNLTAGNSTDITVTIINNVSQALSLQEILPSGWTLTRISDDADTYKARTNEWVWFSMGAGVTKTVTYRLSVPSNATSGTYTLNGSIGNASGIIAAVGGENIINILPETQPPAIYSISGYKINDTNANGLWNTGEAGISGWNITLRNATTGAVITSNSTNSAGFYQFLNLSSGSYNVTEEIRPGWINTNTTFKVVNLNSQDITNLNFTNSNAVRGDINRNGKRDTGDATLMLRTIVELPIPSEYQPVLPIGDMNCNNRIDTGDATLVLRDVVNLPIPRCWEV